MKKIKVFFNGQRLRDMYPHATWFEVLKWKMYRLLRKVTILAFIAGLVFGAFQLGISTTYTKTAEAVKEIQVDNLAKKIDELKWEVVDKLQSCESGGYNENHGLVTFDPDSTGKTSHIASYGLLQFKQPTVIHYMKTLYNKEVNGKEAILIALNEDQARNLARDIIFDVQGGVFNWANCAKKMGLAEEITLIRRLEE